VSMALEIDDSLNDSRESGKQWLMSYFVHNGRSTWEVAIEKSITRKQSLLTELDHNRSRADAISHLHHFIRILAGADCGLQVDCHCKIV